MKILQILPSLDVGGVERGVIDLARAMKRRGEECVVVSSGGELVMELQKMGITHYTLPVHKKSLFSLSLIPRLREIIQREQIDIVHARSRVPAWIAWFAARQAGVPFVTTCHGYYSNHTLSWIMGWGKRVIVISRVIGRHMIDDFKVDPERIRLIHRGVDLSQFLFRTRPAQENSKCPFKIINVGRFSPIKGQIEFIKAVHKVRSFFPSLEVQLVGAEGKGKQKYTEQIRQTIRQLNLESCVQLLGTRRDVPQLLAQADLLVLPTLVPEAFGRVIVEAGAVGTPVVATGLGGVLDIIDHGKNGLIVPPGDIDAMACAIKEILQDREKAKNFSIQMREKVQKEFTLEKMTDETLAVYREVQSEKKILMIKLGAIGDLILVIPSLRMIRERFPNARISFLVDRKLASLVSSAPYLNEVISVDRKKLQNISYLAKLARKLRKEGFDVSVDLQNSKWTHLLAFLSGVRERFGFRRGPFGFLLNRPDRTFEIADSPVKHQFRILSKLGVREFDETLELWTDAEADERIERALEKENVPSGTKLIGLVIGASPGWATKRWPVASFQELAKRLIDEFSCRVVLIGSPEDADRMKEFQSEEILGVVSFVGKTSLTDLVSLVKRLDLLVTGDTAPLHIASAMRRKIVALFGPTDPKRHMPPGNGSVVLTRHLPCQPCYQGTCKNSDELACLKKISVDEVFQAVQRQMSLVKI